MARKLIICPHQPSPQHNYKFLYMHLVNSLMKGAKTSELAVNWLYILALRYMYSVNECTGIWHNIH